MLYTCLPHLPVSGSPLAYVLTLEYDTSFQEYHQSEKKDNKHVHETWCENTNAGEWEKQKNKGLNEEKKNLGKTKSQLYPQETRKGRERSSNKGLKEGQSSKPENKEKH